MEAEVPEYRLDMEHTTIGFRVRHMIVAWTNGRFNSAEGRVRWDPRRLEDSSVEVTIDAASVDTNLKTRDDHLRSEDFFFVSQHPQLSFKSSSIVTRGSDGFDVHGELTIRGRTRPATLEVTDSGQDVLDPWGNFRRGATARARINRKEFGLSWNAALEAGGVAVGDEVQLNLEIELIRKP